MLPTFSTKLPITSPVSRLTTLRPLFTQLKLLTSNLMSKPWKIPSGLEALHSSCSCISWSTSDLLFWGFTRLSLSFLASLWPSSSTRRCFRFLITPRFTTWWFLFSSESQLTIHSSTLMRGNNLKWLKSWAATRDSESHTLTRDPPRPLLWLVWPLLLHSRRTCQALSCL